MFPSNARQIGVAGTQAQMHKAQPAGMNLPPGEIADFQPVEMVAVPYVEEGGNVVFRIAVRVEGQGWFFPANDIQWAASLRPVAKKLADKLETLRQGKNAALPKTDSVDVVGQ